MSTRPSPVVGPAIAAAALREDGAAWVDGWYDRYRAEVGDWASLDRAEFVRIFHREASRLADALEARCDPDLVEAALRSSARDLVRRGATLAEATLAARESAAAARSLWGPDAAEPSPDLVRFIESVELDRAGLFPRLWLRSSRAGKRTCTPQVAGGGPGRGFDAADRPDHGMVGSSPAITRVLRSVARVADGPRSVLVTGESGTGKELIARAIHGTSGRRTFVPIRCAALSPRLAESELFGHVRGALAGVASGGCTLFLDEITELGPELQAKLLRVLEERPLRGSDSRDRKAADAMIVASTTRDPVAAVQQGLLRAELWYRLQAFTLHAPALRDRVEDVPLLVDHFLGSFCHRRCGCIWGLEDRALAALQAYSWPGNVRELRDVVELAITEGDDGLIGLADLPPRVIAALPREAAAADLAPDIFPPLQTGPETDGVLPTLADWEDRLIRRALEVHGGNKSRVAAELGISRQKLYARLRKTGPSSQ